MTAAIQLERLEFDRETHTYRLDGSPIVNVTRITDTLDSYAGVPAEVLRRKAEIGDAVHYATELYDRNDLSESSLPAEIQPYFYAWVKFREETGFEPALIEERVFSRAYRYAGTLDRTGIFTRLKRVKPSEACLVDVKCTAAIMPASGPQTAAYQRALAECQSIYTKRRYVVQLRPDGTYRLHEHSDPTDLAVFLSALTVYAWRQRNGAKEEA